MKEVEFIALINQHQAILLKICTLYRDSKEDSAPGCAGSHAVPRWLLKKLNDAKKVFVSLYLEDLSI